MNPLNWAERFVFLYPFDNQFVSGRSAVLCRQCAGKARNHASARRASCPGGADRGRPGFKDMSVTLEPEPVSSRAFITPAPATRSAGRKIRWCPTISMYRWPVTAARPRCALRVACSAVPTVNVSNPGRRLRITSITNLIGTGNNPGTPIPIARDTPRSGSGSAGAR
jgi:hypothetical protein